MNENIDLTKILKDCPKGTKFYSSIHGDLLYSCMYLRLSVSKITFTKPDSISSVDYYRDGKYYTNQGECTIFPSKDQRDWSKFCAPWLKKERFDPKTLQPFDKVLVKGCVSNTWKCGLFSHVKDDASLYKYSCAGDAYAVCIPYNDETKHLVGTNDEAPEYYRYWED